MYVSPFWALLFCLPAERDALRAMFSFSIFLKPERGWDEAKLNCHFFLSQWLKVGLYAETDLLKTFTNLLIEELGNF